MTVRDYTPHQEVPLVNDSTLQWDPNSAAYPAASDDGAHFLDANDDNILEKALADFSASDPQLFPGNHATEAMMHGSDDWLVMPPAAPHSGTNGKDELSSHWGGQLSATGPPAPSSDPFLLSLAPKEPCDDLTAIARYVSPALNEAKHVLRDIALAMHRNLDQQRMAFKRYVCNLQASRERTWT